MNDIAKTELERLVFIGVIAERLSREYLAECDRGNAVIDGGDDLALKGELTVEEVRAIHFAAKLIALCDVRFPERIAKLCKE